MKVIKPGEIIGIIGGGQLGRMTALAAHALGYKTHVYTQDADSPGAQVSNHVTCAAYDDYTALEKFAKSVDVISFEFENIPEKALNFLEKHNQVRPNSKALYVSQNRIREKGFFKENKIPTNKFFHVRNISELEKAHKELGGGKAILKTSELGYDGKGQAVVDSNSNLKKIWDEAGIKDAILEDFVPFEKEISVVVARGVDTKSIIFPPAENVHVKGILDTSVVPANISKETENEAKKYALMIAEGLHIVGLVAVEFFVLKNGNVIANEIAPRPHNSGHWTMDGCVTSQFEQFVRAICGLPLGSVERHSDVKMKNLIGADVEGIDEILKEPSAKLHLYGKNEARKGRKMGHVNFVKPLS